MSELLLAKSDGETLVEHTLNCIRVAEALVSTLSLEGEELQRLRRDLNQALVYHDVGKAASGFQAALRDRSNRWGRRHEVLSAAFATGMGAEDEVVFAILNHHRSVLGSETDSYPTEEIPFKNDLKPVWEEMEEEWYSNITVFADEWERIRQELGMGQFPPNPLSPLRLSRKWISKYSQNRDIPFERRKYASLLRGLVVTSDHIASGAGKGYNPIPVPRLSAIDLGVKNLYAFQKRASEHRGNLILRAPTGSGKTNAALLWAMRNQHLNGRLIYVLPNQASINAMYLRLASHFGKNSVGLLHGRAASSLYSMMENDEDSMGQLDRQKTARNKGDLSRELWYPVKVCTPHQVLRYMLHGKGWELMLAEFPHGLFVFDEIHAYDPTVTGLTVATAKFLQKIGASCIFMSATLPSFLKGILEREVPDIGFIEPSPMEETDQIILSKKRHAINIVDGDMLAHLGEIASAAGSAASTLVVCNHVRTAQLVYQGLQRLVDGEVRLLHSRFNRRDRNRKEGDLKHLPKVLVSTQVVEVSLDIDFELGFTEPAPIDALVQRLGRVNRRGSMPPALVTVFTEQVGRYHIYEQQLVDRSLDALSKLGNPVSESDLVDAADEVYGRGYQGEELHRYSSALDIPMIKDPENNWLAGSHKDWVEQLISEKEGTLEVLPESLTDEYEDLSRQRLSIEAGTLLVPIRRESLVYLYDEIEKPSNPSKPWVIRKPYSTELGLDLSAGAE